MNSYNFSLLQESIQSMWHWIQSRVLGKHDSTKTHEASLPTQAPSPPIPLKGKRAKV